MSEARKSKVNQVRNAWDADAKVYQEQIAALKAENEALKKEKLEWQLEPLKIRALEDQVRSITEKIYSSEDFADALALSKPGRLLPIDDEGRHARPRTRRR